MVCVGVDGCPTSGLLRRVGAVDVPVSLIGSAFPIWAAVAPNTSSAARVFSGGASSSGAECQVIEWASRLLRVAVVAPSIVAIATPEPPEVSEIDSVAACAESVTFR